MTVCCVWVHANVAYSSTYVVNLQAMVAKHLPIAHRFVCLCDQPSRLPRSMETMPVTVPDGLYGWWAKLDVFTPERFTGRVLYLDLDSLVVADLTPIVTYPAPFALVPAGGTFQPRDGRQCVKRFNSSVMVWDAGTCDALATRWSLRDAHRLHGDQDYIGEQRPEAAAMPAPWFPRLSELRGRPPGPEARVVLCKKPKNAVAADRYPWVDKVWRAA